MGSQSGPGVRPRLPINHQAPGIPSKVRRSFSPKTPGGSPLPLPFEVIACICSYLGPEAKSTLRAVLLTGWDGYEAAVPYLYRDVAMQDIGRLVAELCDCDIYTLLLSYTCPTPARHERSKAALKHVRRLRVEAWRSPPTNTGGLLPHTIDHLSNLRTVTFGVAATPPNMSSYSQDLIFNAWTFKYLQGAVASSLSDICIHVSGNPRCQPASLTWPLLYHICLLVHPWKWRGRDDRPTLNLHGFEDNLAMRSLCDVVLPSDTLARLWPPAELEERWGELEADETPWQQNLAFWSEQIHPGLDATGMYRAFPGKCEVVGVRPVFDLTCKHRDKFATSTFWLKVLLKMEILERPIDIDMSFGATCPCGEVAPREAWCSAPLLKALGRDHDDLVGQMRGLDARLPPPPTGPCNAHHWDVADMARAANRRAPDDFEVARAAVVESMLRDARRVLARTSHVHVSPDAVAQAIAQLEDDGYHTAGSAEYDGDSE